MRSRFNIFVVLFLVLWGRSAPAPTFREICARALGALAGRQTQQVPEGRGVQALPPQAAVATNNFETMPERLRFLLSVLERHPNIVTANLSYRRNLLDTLSHISELQKILGARMAPLEEGKSRTVSAQYVPDGNFKYDEAGVRSFLSDRVKDLDGLDLLPHASLAEQLAHIKQTSKTTDGSFDDPTLSRFPVIADIVKIEKARQGTGQGFEEAEREWLRSSEVEGSKKARLLGLHLNSEKFEELERIIPERQRAQVDGEIRKRSSFFVFRDLARKSGVDASVLSKTRLESFEYVKLAPEVGKKVMLGSPPGEAGRYDNEVQREVTFDKPFAMGETEVTQLQYALVMGENPSRFKDGEGSIEITVNGKRIRVQPNHPVENVSWNDGEKYFKKLSQLDPESNYRHPTEAEWEYAARGGTSTRFSFGDSNEELLEHGWHDKNAEGKTHAVAELRPNQFGFYDMHGLLWEWTMDKYVQDPSKIPYNPDFGEDA